MKRALIMNFKFKLLMNTFFYLTQYLIHEDGPGKKIPADDCTGFIKDTESLTQILKQFQN